MLWQAPFWLQGYSSEASAFIELIGYGRALEKKHVTEKYTGSYHKVSKHCGRRPIKSPNSELDGAEVKKPWSRTWNNFHVAGPQSRETVLREIQEKKVGSWQAGPCKPGKKMKVPWNSGF